jgi:hypothetical protein
MSRLLSGKVRLGHVYMFVFNIDDCIPRLRYHGERVPLTNYGELNIMFQSLKLSQGVSGM